VVPSYDESKKPDRYYCIDHTQVAKHRFLGISLNYVSDSPKGWDNQDIYFRVSKESEKVLVKDWVTSSSGVVERCREVTISQKHSDTSSQNW
jgi:hypothetical protein